MDARTAKRRGAIGVALLACAAIAWLWLAPDAERDALTQAVEGIRAGVQQGDFDAVRSRVADDYADAYGHEADSAVQRALDAVASLPEPAIELAGMRVDWGDDKKTATTTFRVLVTGSGPRSEEVRALEKNRKLHVHWRRDRGGWKVIRVEVRYGLL